MYCDWPWSPDCTYIYNYDRHIIVHMTGLYIRLVTYARLPILTLVIRIPVIYILHIFVLNIDYSVMFYFSYDIVIACVIIYEYLFLYTHSLGRFWRPWIRTSRDFWTPYIVQVFVWSYALREVGVSLFLTIGILSVSYTHLTLPTIYSV